jgi:hypothetical protein
MPIFRERRHLTLARSAGGALASLWLIAAIAPSCFDAGTRWLAPPPEPVEPPICEVGELRCSLNLEQCADTEAGLAWVVEEDCVSQDKVCALTLEKCTLCLPEVLFCDGQDVGLCAADGESFEVTETCDPSVGEACRGGACPHLCSLASQEKSNVGCEYWAVDLDNAMIDAARNAAAQQYAVVVSNPQPDVPIEVRIFQDDSTVGSDHIEVEIANAVIAPLNLRVFKLGPREVDGSPPGSFNTGTHTAITRHAYKVVSDFPIIATQFNPLENVSVFSNDASLLKPREALDFGTQGTVLSYVVAGWPQTIAVTDNPNTNFSSQNPTNLRAFLTIVGTSDDTNVIVRPTTRILGGPGVLETFPGTALNLTVHAYEVVNLETPDMNSFDADFTGTIIEADKPVAVFTGGEASDAPDFDTLAQRRCCADHLEEQLDPVRTAGKLFALAHTPSRTSAVLAAGGVLGVAPEPDYFRFVSTTPEAATIVTTLPPPDDQFKLYGIGDFYQVTTFDDFTAESDQPIHVVQVMASQDAANVPRGYPGGDPSLVVVPPREQFRPDYVFLTPDKYAFDFIMVVAPPEASLFLDGAPLDGQSCEIVPTDGLSAEQRGEAPIELISYRCQLSFATVHPDTGAVTPGLQNDGVHRLVADVPVGLTVWGFDAFVSYAYAGGTELREIAIPK